MDACKRLLLENKAWAQDKATHPTNVSPAPEFVWIGSSDPLVSPERITGSGAGDFLVHRNLGNLVVHTDLNLLAVLEHGVSRMGVGQVIVCGHYGCLGVEAAMDRGPSNATMNTWLNHIRDVWRVHKDELAMHDDVAARRRLVELNVLHQVQNLARTEIIQQAWADRQAPTLHGLVYDHETYLIRPLVHLQAGAALDEVHQLRLPAAAPSPAE